MRRILTVGLVWTAAWWLIVGLLVAPVVSGGWATVLAGWLLSFAPFPYLVLRFGGAPPPAAVRLFVYRPFWYLQLAMPLLALSGLVGALAGALFGAAGPAGRGVLSAVAVL